MSAAVLDLLPGFPPVAALAGLTLQYLGNAQWLVLSLQAKQPAPFVDINMAAAELMEQKESALLDELWKLVTLDYERIARAAARFGNVVVMRRAFKTGKVLMFASEPGVADASLMCLYTLTGRCSPSDAACCRDPALLDRIRWSGVEGGTIALIVEHIVNIGSTMMIERAITYWREEVAAVAPYRSAIDAEAEAMFKKHGIDVSDPGAHEPDPCHLYLAAASPDGVSLRRTLPVIANAYHMADALYRCFLSYPNKFKGILEIYAGTDTPLPKIVLNGGDPIFCDVTVTAGDELADPTQVARYQAARLGIVNLCACKDLDVISRIASVIVCESGDMLDILGRTARHMLLPQVAALAETMKAARVARQK